jgi:hypothetical protein
MLMIADVNDSLFALTQADMHQGSSKLPPGADVTIEVSFSNTENLSNRDSEAID